MMVTARSGTQDKTTFIRRPDRYAWILICYYWTVDRPRSSISAGGWRRPEGVEKSAGVLTVSFRESPLHFPYLSDYRVEASDLASLSFCQFLFHFILMLPPTLFFHLNSFSSSCCFCLLASKNAFLFSNRIVFNSLLTYSLEFA